MNTPDTSSLTYTGPVGRIAGTVVGSNAASADAAADGGENGDGDGTIRLLAPPPLMPEERRNAMPATSDEHTDRIRKINRTRIANCLWSAAYRLPLRPNSYCLYTTEGRDGNDDDDDAGSSADIAPTPGIRVREPCLTGFLDLTSPLSLLPLSLAPLGRPP